MWCGMPIYGIQNTFFRIHSISKFIDLEPQKKKIHTFSIQQQQWLATTRIECIFMFVFSVNFFYCHFTHQRVIFRKRKMENDRFSSLSLTLHSTCSLFNDHMVLLNLCDIGNSEDFFFSSLKFKRLFPGK